MRFDVPRQGGRPPLALLTLWYDPADTFDLAVLTPSGQELPVPAVGTTDTYSSPSVDIEIARNAYAPSASVQVQVTLSFRSAAVPSSLLNDWGLRVRCTAAATGRIDGWFANPGFGRFDPHPLVEDARTVGMPATARQCLAVASHVSKAEWASDVGLQKDLGVLVGRSSPFSSRGPTRDGRLKPDVSAPGQYLTAALAAGSELAGFGERVRAADRLLTIEGTSMAAPVVAGVVALMLQKKRSLTPDKVRAALADSARIDGHVGTAGWNPTYGHGKVDVAKAISLV